jgi:hypothetical protein
MSKKKIIEQQISIGGRKYCITAENKGHINARIMKIQNVMNEMEERKEENSNEEMEE